MGTRSRARIHVAVDQRPDRELGFRCAGPIICSVRLYHYSNVDTSTLVPSHGGRRHEGEDPRAVGKPVLWLSDASMSSTPPHDFEYVVDVDEGDPALFRDELFAKGIDALVKQFGSGRFHWYWLERTIVPVEKRRWSPTSHSYEPAA